MHIIYKDYIFNHLQSIAYNSINHAQGKDLQKVARWNEGIKQCSMQIKQRHQTMHGGTWHAHAWQLVASDDWLTNNSNGGQCYTDVSCDVSNKSSYQWPAVVRGGAQLRHITTTVHTGQMCKYCTSCYPIKMTYIKETGLLVKTLPHRLTLQTLLHIIDSILRDVALSEFFKSHIVSKCYYAGWCILYKLHQLA